MQTMMTALIPTRKDILSDFLKWTRKGSDSQHQFRQVVRRWVNCGYPLSELPLLFTVSEPEIESAIEFNARTEGSEWRARVIN